MWTKLKTAGLFMLLSPIIAGLGMLVLVLDLLKFAINHSKSSNSDSLSEIPPEASEHIPPNPKR